MLAYSGADNAHIGSCGSPDLQTPAFVKLHSKWAARRLHGLNTWALHECLEGVAKPRVTSLARL